VWTRVAGEQEMTNGRSLQRHLYHFGLPTVFTEWAHLAHDRIPPLSTLTSRNTRAPHFTPQHWLLCHMGLY